MISVITPSYNRKSMLKDAIESLFKQSYKDWELIVIDDCSTDGTQKMMEEYKKNPQIRYYRNDINMKNPGLCRNKGFTLAKGEYIIFMDDDDYYIDDKFFEKAMEIYKNNNDKNLCLVTANAFIEIVSNGVRKNKNIGISGYVDGIDFLLGIGNKYNKPHSTFTSIFTMESLKKAGFSTMKMVNDYAIFLRALLYGNAYIMEDYIGCYRVHKDNISFNIEKKFLMENLAERVWVKPKIIEKIGEKKVNEWWKSQMNVLIRYFLFKSNPSMKEGKEVVSYIMNNTGFDLIFYIKIKLMYFGYKPYGLIKQIFKKILKR